jgi:hypothetical protein
MTKASAAPALTAAEPAPEQAPLSEADRDELDEADRRRLHEALERAEADYQRGDYVDADVALAELRGILYGGA